MYLSGEECLFERVTKLYMNEGIVSSSEDLNVGMDLNFSVFPNPSNSTRLFLSFAPTAVSEVAITISTVDGRLRFQQKEYANNGKQAFAIDISTLTNGIYSIKLDDGKRKGIAKFIVQ